MKIEIVNVITKEIDTKDFKVDNHNFAEVIASLNLNQEYNYEFFVNFEQQDYKEDPEWVLYYAEDKDFLQILVTPSFAAFTLAAFLKALGGALLSMAISYIANALFAPKPPEEDNEPVNTAYSLSSQTNRPNIGNYVPVSYGNVKMFPNTIGDALVTYRGNNQNVSQCLVVGQGTYKLNQLFMGTTDITNNPGVTAKLIKTGPTKKLADIINNPMMTHPIVKAEDTIQNWKMTTGVLSQRIDLIKDTEIVQINLSAPQGLFRANPENGGWEMWLWVYFFVYIYDEHDNLIIRTTGYFEPQRINPKNRKDPLKETQYFDMTPYPDAKYIKIYRYSPEWTESNYLSQCYVEQVFFLLKNEIEDYGDTQLLYLNLEASQTLAGANRINGFFERVDERNTLKDIIIDIYTNDKYGADLPITDLYFDNASQYPLIDCSFQKLKTVYDSIDMIAKPQMYHVIPNGAKLNITQDAPKYYPVQKYDASRMYNVKMERKFFDVKEEYDCIEVEYRDENWLPATIRVPQDGIKPKKVVAFGVADRSKAITFGKYMYKQEKLRTTSLSFSTDVQGRIPNMLDTVIINHSTVDSNMQDKVFQVIKSTIDEDTVEFELINYDERIYDESVVSI